MKKVNVAVLVSGGGTNLQALINAEKNGIIKDGNIKVVISNNASSYALVRAKENGIKTETVIKKLCKDKLDFENKIIKILQENDISLIVLAGFMCILTENFTKKYENRIINVHPSLIPSFCGEGFYGLKVHEEALKYGVKITGATVHYVNEIADGGKIILQKAVEILDGDTPEILQKRVMEQAEWKILPKALNKVCTMIAKGEIKWA